MKPCLATMAPLALAVMLAACTARTAPPATVYGSPPNLDSRAVTLEQALSDSNVGRTLAVRARVAEVCRMKGCWMVLTDGARSARVTFKNYGFFVPKDLAGRTVVAEGTLSRKLLTADEADHLAKESSAPAPPPGPREEWSLVASSIVVPAEP